jgi:hypothetical protein
MIIIGCDYHPAFSANCVGRYRQRRLQHREEAEKYYRDLAALGIKVRVGMEASGHARWFERLLGELQFELWIGDAAEIRTERVRKQKTGSPGCGTDSALVAGRSFSAGLDAERDVAQALCLIGRVLARSSETPPQSRFPSRPLVACRQNNTFCGMTSGWIVSQTEAIRLSWRD